MKNSSFKKFSLLIIFLVILGLAVPLYQAQAAWWTEQAALIASKILGFFLQLGLGMTTAVLWLANLILGWVISPGFIAVPYTSGGIVDIGLDITKGFANIGIVFALIVIALATALRYKDYQAKKSLPLLIGMALLINFAPVICGLVVDASNIIMNFFLGEVSDQTTIWNIAQTQWANLVPSFTNLEGFIVDNMNLVLSTICLMAFEVFAAFFLILYAVLFIVRYIAIWTLVIMSPLAFVAYILPGAKKYFTKWWSTFFQWCFVGIPAAFFLYLTEQLLIKTQNESIISVPPLGTPGAVFVLSSSFAIILQYCIAIVLLLLGFLASLSLGAVGAGAIIATGKIIGGGMVKGMAKWEGKRIGQAGINLANKTGITSLSTKMATSKSKIPGIGFLARRIGAAELRMVKAGTDTVSKDARKKSGERSVAENLSAYRSTTNEAERVGIILGMQDKKQFKDALDPNKFGNRVLSNEEVLKTYKKAQQMGEKDAIEGIEFAFVGKDYGKDSKGNKIAMAQKFAEVVDKKTEKYTAEGGKDITHGGLTGEDREKFKSYTDKIIAGITSSDDIKLMQKGWWKNSDVLDAAGKFWGGHQIGEAAKTFGRSFIEEFQGHAESGPKGLNHFAVVNPKVPLFLASNLAQELGFNSLGGLDQKGIKEKINEMREVRGIPNVQGMTSRQILEKQNELNGKLDNIRADQNIQVTEKAKLLNDTAEELKKYNKAQEWKLEEESRQSPQQPGQQPPPPAPARGGGGQPQRKTYNPSKQRRP